MSVSEQKTHAEIVAEMRNRAKRPDFVSQDVLKSCADELDAAHKREMVELRKQVGNMAALREALKDIVRIVEQIRLLYSDFPYEIHDIARKARAALAAQPRNCDVGVPEERIQRWSKFCKARSKKLPPIHGFEWEDYPYESEVKEGGNNANE